SVGDGEGQESEVESARDFFPVPYRSAFEISSAVRLKSGKNFISCFISHKDSTAVRARAASTWPIEFHTGAAIPMVPRIASPSLVAYPEQRILFNSSCSRRRSTIVRSVSLVILPREINSLSCTLSGGY